MKNKIKRWKIRYKIKINFVPIKGTGEKRLKHLKGDNIETMVIDKSDAVI